MDFKSAIEKHAEWKTKFRMAITKKETLDVAIISKDNCCDLGKWLHGEGKSKFGETESLRECVVSHAKFHAEAAKIATAINSKKYEEASAMLNAGTSYASASNSVGVAIMKLQKETGF